MTRITVNLSKQEIGALVILAERELRHPRSQAALIIRQELLRQGLIEIEQPSTSVLTEENKVAENTVEESKK